MVNVDTATAAENIYTFGVMSIYALCCHSGQELSRVFWTLHRNCVNKCIVSDLFQENSCIPEALVQSPTSVTWAVTIETIFSWVLIVAFIFSEMQISKCPQIVIRGHLLIV